MNAIESIKKYDPCDEAVEWLEDKTAKEAWNTCKRGDWMLWIAKRCDIDLKVLTLAKVKCASLVKHLMKDGRSLKALEVAERFANGEATREELDAAAYAAADAVADAAAYSAPAWTAAICRKVIPFESLGLNDE